MKKITATVFAFAIFTFVFVSCDEFFSTSFGKPRKYDISKINITAGNLDKWIDLAVGNPELAAALTEKIIQELDSKTGAEKAKFMDAGVKLAVESSGLGESILSNSADILADLADADSDELEGILTKLFENIRNDFNSGNGQKAADNIAAIASKDIEYTEQSNGWAPQFGQEYRDTASPGDVAEAILVLVLGELGDADIEDWNKLPKMDLAYDPDEGCFVVKGVDPSDNQIAVAAYINLIIVGGDKFNDNPLTSAIMKGFDLASLIL